MTDGAPHARPTLRCAVEDLLPGLGPPELRDALTTFADDQQRDPNHLLPVPLRDAEHPLLEKANTLTSPSAQRERIAKVTTPPVYKVKTSDMRGALMRGDHDVWWLLCGGNRKDDGPGDFYRGLSSDLSPLAPSDADIRYLALERAYDAECEAEREVRSTLVGALIDAASSVGTPIPLTIFGAEISLRFNPDENDLVVLEISWDFIEYSDQERFPHDVLAMVPGCEAIEVWDYWPPLEGAPSPHAYQTLVPRSWMQDLATAAELDDLLERVADPDDLPTPSSDGSEAYSHYASRRAVTMAYVRGIEIEGICGARVVAHRDYEAFPVCPHCANTLAVLRETGHA